MKIKKILRKAVSALLSIAMLATLMVSMPVLATDISADEINTLQLITAEGKAATSMAVGVYKHATVSAEEEISGKKAVKTVTTEGVETSGNGKGLNVTLPGSNRLDTVQRGSYLEFDFYAEDITVLPYNIEMHARDINETAGVSLWPANKYYFPTDGVKAGEWNHIKIDLDNWYEGQEIDTFENLCQFNFLIPNETASAVTFYVTDMKITYPINIASKYQLITSRGGNALGSNTMAVQAKSTDATVTASEAIAGKKAVKTTVTAGKSSGLHLNFTNKTNYPYPDSPKSGDYLEFDFYMNDISTLPSTIEMHTKDDDKSANGSNAWLANKYDFPTDGVKAGEWNHIKIDLDNWYEGYDLSHYEKLCQFIFYMPKTTTAETTFYITDMAIVTYGDLGVVAAEGTESTYPVISWNNTYDSSLTRLKTVSTSDQTKTYETGSYKVYRNGAEVGSVEVDANATGYTFTDTTLPNPNEVQELTYEVKAVSIDGKTVKFADEDTLFYIPNQDNVTTEYELISDQGVKNANLSSVKWSTWSEVKEGVEIDGRTSCYSWASFTGSPSADDAWKAAIGKNLNIMFANSLEMTGKEYLEFWIYSEDFAPMSVALDYGTWETIELNVAKDQWNFVRVPVYPGELIGLHIGYEEADDANAGFKIYLNDMSIRRYENIVDIAGSTTGTVSETVQAGETLTFATDLLYGVEKSTVIVGEYNSDEILSTVKILTAEDMTYTVGENAEKVRVFLWNDINTITPLAGDKTLTVTTLQQ